MEDADKIDPDIAHKIRANLPDSDSSDSETENVLNSESGKCSRIIAQSAQSHTGRRNDNETDDDKLHADKRASKDKTNENELRMKFQPYSNLKKVEEPNEISPRSKLPDVIPDVCTDSVTPTMTDSKVLNNNFSDTPPPLPDSEPPTLQKSESPPPLPVSSPPPLFKKASDENKEITYESSIHDKTDQNDEQLFKSCPPGETYSSQSMKETDVTYMYFKEHEEKEHFLSDYDSDSTVEYDSENEHSNDIVKSKCDMVNGVEIQDINCVTENRNDCLENISVPNNTDISNAQETFLTLLSEFKNKDTNDANVDFDDEFEAIFNSLNNSNMGQDQYHERFAGRRDKYGFILSPIIESPSPTPSCMSGYSGLSSASPDPFSMFRVSPAPRSGKRELDLSSLSKSVWDSIEEEKTVPIYQNRPKVGIYIPEGTGWDSDNELLTPTSGSEWDSFPSGLSTPPVNNDIQFGNQLKKLQRPENIIYEGSESSSAGCDSDDSEDTLQGSETPCLDEDCANKVDSNIHRKPENNIDKDVFNYVRTIKCDETDGLANTESSIPKLNNNSVESSEPVSCLSKDSPKEEMAEGNLTEMQDTVECILRKSLMSLNHTRGQSDRNNSDTDSDEEDSDDEYFEDESDKEYGNVDSTDEIDNDKHAITKTQAYQNININSLDECLNSTAYIFVPISSVVVSGTMTPDNIDSVSSSDDDSESPNMSSFGSGVKVSQYTSGDSESSDTEMKISYKNQFNDNDSEAQGSEKEVMAEENKGVGSVRFHSPLDFSFLDSDKSTFIDNSPRSPRVLGRHYLEMNENERALCTSPPVITKNEINSAEESNVMTANKDLNEINSNSYKTTYRNNQKLALEESFKTVIFQIQQSKSPMQNDGTHMQKKSETAAFSSDSDIDSEQQIGDSSSDGNNLQNKFHIAEDEPQQSTGIKQHERANQNTGWPTDWKMGRYKFSRIAKSPVKIKISHLKRKVSARNKIKPGYVKDVSKVFSENKTQSPDVCKSQNKHEKSSAELFDENRCIHTLFANEEIEIPQENENMQWIDGSLHQEDQIMATPLENECKLIETETCNPESCLENDDITYSCEVNSDSESEIQVSEFTHVDTCKGHDQRYPHNDVTDSEKINGSIMLEVPEHLSEQTQDRVHAQAMTKENKISSIHTNSLSFQSLVSHGVGLTCSSLGFETTSFAKQNIEIPSCTEADSHHKMSAETAQENTATDLSNNISMPGIQECVVRDAKLHENTLNSEGNSIGETNVKRSSETQSATAPLHLEVSLLKEGTCEGASIRRKCKRNAKIADITDDHELRNKTWKRDTQTDTGSRSDMCISENNDNIHTMSKSSCQMNIEQSTHSHFKFDHMSAIPNVCNRNVENTHFSKQEDSTAQIEQARTLDTKDKSLRSFSQHLDGNMNNDPWSNVVNQINKYKAVNPDFFHTCRKDVSSFSKDTDSAECSMASTSPPLHEHVDIRSQQNTRESVHKADWQYTGRTDRKLEQRLDYPSSNYDGDDDMELINCMKFSQFDNLPCPQSDSCGDFSTTDAPDIFQYTFYDVRKPIPTKSKLLKSTLTQSDYSDQANRNTVTTNNTNANRSDNNLPVAKCNDANCDKCVFDFPRPACHSTGETNFQQVIFGCCNVNSENINVISHRSQGGDRLSSDLTNECYRQNEGVHIPRRLTANKNTHQTLAMNNDAAANVNTGYDTHFYRARINGNSLRETQDVCHSRMPRSDISSGQGGSRLSKDTTLGVKTSDSPVLFQSSVYDRLIEDERGRLKGWPYSDIENQDRVPVKIYKTFKKVSLEDNKPRKMRLVQTEERSAEMPDDITVRKIHSSSVLPANTSEKQLMQSHSESIQAALQTDSNGNMLNDEEIASVLPRLAETVANMKNINAEEVMPGITQTVAKLKDGGNLVITTMTRQVTEDKDNEDIREVQPHPVLDVDDLENSKIYLVQDSKGDLFYVEDVTSETQESAYFSSSRHTSESISDSGSSPTFQRISKIKQVGNGGIKEAKAEELISAMYDQNGITEMDEFEDEYSERTYEFDLPKNYRHQDSLPRQDYSKDSFRTSYMVEEPDSSLPVQSSTVQGGKTTTKDHFESSYETTSGHPWVIDGAAGQYGSQINYSHAMQSTGEELEKASSQSETDNVFRMQNVMRTSEATGSGHTTTTEKYTIEAEAFEYPEPQVDTTLYATTPAIYVPPLPPVPVGIQTDEQQNYSLVKVDMTPKSVTPKTEMQYEQKEEEEKQERPIYKTVAHIETKERSRPPPMGVDITDSKKYKIITTKPSPVEEVQESHMSFGEVDYRMTTENVEYKLTSPTYESKQYYVRNSARPPSPERFISEKRLELSQGSNQKHKTEIQVKDSKDYDTQTYEENSYSYDKVVQNAENTDGNMRVVRGSYLIKNTLDEVDGTLDDNLNMFDGNFTLRKDNPLYQSDEDIYKRFEREKAENARKQERFQRDLNQDISFETVDKFSKSKTVKREERPKQSLSQLLLSRLSTIEAKDIRQHIDVKHHSEDIYGDPSLLHADGSQVRQPGTNNFDSVGEKVDLLLKEGKAFITVTVTAERITPVDMEFNVWRKNQAIVTRVIEVDLLATEQRRRLYYQVMEEPGSKSRGVSSYRAGPNETVLDSQQTLELFTRILGAADGEGDKEDITVKTRQMKTTKPFTTGMDLLY